ncbi:flocculation protein FLO11 [Cimex lectularius]|uniref:protein-tyrosine-phosphatase n=1 Tax=Cimex lectularius TaxID=79782 RepID=A0A8I6S2J0_CIMLE|nr:flocculation protein FLO11 [Cimex lectularius]XP_014255910.1 flocculation protein FLO11 [Cimex lectularius]
MKCIFSEHLYWVLLVIFISNVIGEDDTPRLPTTNAKLPLMRKLNIHRKPLKDDPKKNVFSQPPDDITSTTSVSLEQNINPPNRTVDHFSRNTVPVVGPTEATGKQNGRTKGGSPGPGSLLVFKTLTTKTFGDGTIDLPPTGWALASMKTSKNTIGSNVVFKRPTTTPSVIISDYWSNRLSKTSTPSSLSNESGMQQDATAMSSEKNETSPTTMPPSTMSPTPSIPLIHNFTDVAMIDILNNTKPTIVKDNTSLPTDNSEPNIVLDKIIGNVSTIDNLVKIVKSDVKTIVKPNRNISLESEQRKTSTEKTSLAPPNVDNVPFEVNETKLIDQSTTSMTRATNATQQPILEMSTESNLIENNTTTKLDNDSIPVVNNTIVAKMPKPEISTLSTKIEQTAETFTTIGNDIPDITQKVKKSNFTVKANTPHREINQKPNEFSSTSAVPLIVSTVSANVVSSTTPTPPVSTFITSTSDEFITIADVNNSNTVNTTMKSTTPLIKEETLAESMQNETSTKHPITERIDVVFDDDDDNNNDGGNDDIEDDMKEETTETPMTQLNTIKNVTLLNSILEESTTQYAMTSKESKNPVQMTTPMTTAIKPDINLSNNTMTMFSSNHSYSNNKTGQEVNEVTHKSTTEKADILEKVNEINQKIVTVLNEKSTTEVPTNQIKLSTTTILSQESTTTDSFKKNTTPEIIITNLTSLHSDVENKTAIILKETADTDEDDSFLYNTTSFEKIPNDSDLEEDDDSEDVEKDTEPGLLYTTLKPTESSVEESQTPLTVTIFSKVEPKKIPSVDDEKATEMYGIPKNVELEIQAMYGEMCNAKEELKDAIAKLLRTYAERVVSTEQVKILDLGPSECLEENGQMDISPARVHLILTDKDGQYSKVLTEIVVTLIQDGHFQFKYPINKVDTLITPIEMANEGQLGGTVIAAIVISSIAGISLLVLTILLVIMRKRQKGFNYGQRCTPVSLDDYSLDNISVYNSVRRKAMRASKRSYGNPAFDDPVAISVPLNFAGLTNAVSDKAKLEEEFSKVPMVTVKPDELPMGAEVKNRYANVIPLPETRVHINTSTTNDIVEQFINANYVKGAKGVEKFYIACQAPLPNTIADFWQLVWEQQSKIIIMLTDLHENGVEKCADYLPPSEVLDCHRVFGDLQVTLKKRETREKYIISNLQLKNLETNSWREVTHMWYISWPARGIPDDKSSIIAFLIEARSYAKPGPPVVVHCSPGTSRTGTIIAIDIGIRDFETDRIVDIPKTVYNIRKERAGAVQTNEQYRLIYEVLHLYATKLTGGGLDSI